MITTTCYASNVPSTSRYGCNVHNAVPHIRSRSTTATQVMYGTHVTTVMVAMRTLLYKDMSVYSRPQLHVRLCPYPFANVQNTKSLLTRPPRLIRSPHDSGNSLLLKPEHPYTCNTTQRKCVLKGV